MKRAACIKHYGTAVSDRRVRQVWAALTANPHASIQEIAQQLDYRAPGCIHAALHMLRDMGYIAFDNRAVRARTVIVPFHVSRTDS
jgi:predicted transcriptional regulator